MITTNGQLYQWDTGRIVEVYHLKSSTVSEIHVFNGTTDSALVLELSEIDGKTVAKIPDELLQHNYNMDIYAVVIDRFGKYTTEHLNTRVLSRPKPSDYVYTPSEVRTYEALEERIKELEKGEVSDKKLAEVIGKYLEEHNISADVYFRTYDGYIQYSKDSKTWDNIISLTELKGDKGDTPTKGKDYFTESDKQEIVDEVVESLDLENIGGVTSWDDLTDKPFGEDEEGNIQYLDEKYIPNTIARKNNIPAIDSMELITIEDIDTICGGNPIEELGAVSYEMFDVELERGASIVTEEGV